MRWTKLPVVLMLIGGIAHARCDASARKLVAAYPHYLKTCTDNAIVWRDGSRMVYDDGKRKSFDTALNHPDIEDMFRYRYPVGASGYNRPPARNVDPGRIRYEPLFRKMYGDSAAQVRHRLVPVRWFGQTIRVTKVNGVAGALKRVEKDLQRAVARDPVLRKYLTPIGGTFKWRKIAGTNRLSVHSFGAAIDINVKYSAYWRWSKGAYKYRNQIPLPVVEAFERHGFIWGGKWYHYDTMHFEYRPELLGRRSGRVAASSAPVSRKTPPPSRQPTGSPDTYTVVSGDTLYGIARKLHTSVRALREANALESDTIRVGQRLTIPHGGRSR